MKAKIGVTVFQNGDVDILKASVYEELWKDYRAFKGRAARYHEKNSAKGEFLARRYERAALLALFAFFEGVVDRWIKEVERETHIPMSMPDVLTDKCRLLSRRVCLPPFCGITCDMDRLLPFIERYEQPDVSMMEHVDGDILQDIEAAVDEYLSFIERSTGFSRFPALSASTEALMETIGTWNP